MLIRSNSHQSKLPQPNSAYIKHRDQLAEKTRRIFSVSSSRSSQRKLSTALFKTTARTNIFSLKPQSQQVNYHRKVEEDARPETVFRPNSSESSSKCHRAQSPLSIIRTRSKIASKELTPFESNTPPRKTNFLRRGSAIDKAVINNVLKSKFNQNVCTPTFTYCDHE